MLFESTKLKRIKYLASVKHILKSSVRSSDEKIKKDIKKQEMHVVYNNN